jgi:hypothetical protein
VVLDQFAGSGTTILAAEKVGRVGFRVDYEPQTRSNSSDAPHLRRLRPVAGHSQPKSATAHRTTIAFGGEGGFGGRIAVESESGHA